MNRDFLGTGWRFPVRLDPKGGIAYSRQERDIEEAVWIILGTAKSERVMLPEFGCGIHDWVFAPVNPATLGQLEHDVSEALKTWEPRIEVLEVKVEEDEDEPHKVLIRVDYKVLSTNSYANLVYPFYLTERGGK